MVALNATMGPSGARRKASAEALLQRRELVLQRGRDLVLADGGEPLFDERDLLPPLVDVDVERGLDVLDRLGQAGRLDVVGRGHEADRRLLGVRLALEPLDDPLENARVLAEARPQEPAVVAAP